ncbi:tumor necrosis factor receptor superfamily member 17 isoform X1 [Pongo abelii]|uniref:tumor necrosis factor receptor superfamily member 17 isoform X1 n=1 Tax=Pongo abelii TaxID=9601 RepID=UPI0023E86A5D|nr:tumor necrosis factor receptor superfamily member 17 isoform X1 [Pongo abelii]
MGRARNPGSTAHLPVDFRRRQPQAGDESLKYKAREPSGATRPATLSCVRDRKMSLSQSLRSFWSRREAGGVTNSVKGTNAILWTCLGLSLIISLAVFVLTFLLRKMSSEPLKDEFKNTGSGLLGMANIDVEKSRTGDEIILPRGLEYTVEECTCEDCIKSKPKVDSDHCFPLPAMEEGATILVTTKTNDYCKSLPAALSATEIEKSISARELTISTRAVPL